MRWKWSFFCDFELLEASQTIADHRMYIPRNCSSVASLLLTMRCLHILLRFSSQGDPKEIYNREFPITYHMTYYYIPFILLKTVWRSDSNQVVCWDIQILGARFPTYWKMHRRASHSISMHRRSVGTSHRGYEASQRVSGPLHTYLLLGCVLLYVWFVS